MFIMRKASKMEHINDLKVTDCKVINGRETQHFVTLDWTGYKDDLSPVFGTYTLDFDDARITIFGDSKSMDTDDGNFLKQLLDALVDKGDSDSLKELFHLFASNVMICT